MRPAYRLAAVLAALGTLAAARGRSHADPLPPPRAPANVTESTAPVVSSHGARLDDDPATYSACAAPSVVRLRAPDDTADATVAYCAPGDPWSQIPDHEESDAARCEAAGRPGLLARALSGALPLDPATAAHVRTIFQSGLRQGRRTDAFGLVGDSLTATGPFLRAFARPRELPTEVAKALTLASGKNVVDYFRESRPAEPQQYANPFLAPRAAKVGAVASWPLHPFGNTEETPLSTMVAVVDPAYAVVLYGPNDALTRTDPAPDVQARMRQEYSSALAAIADALETRGIVPILTTVPKHEREPGWPDCSTPEHGGSNERFAAQATMLSAAVADLACARHLPLVDLRWALDPLVNHGVGPDGVHLSYHPESGGRLDDEGLQCGTNVRNLVTLRELARVVDAATAGVW
jgi:hypothetical protein